jgi:hypothetical protein
VWQAFDNAVSNGKGGSRGAAGEAGAPGLGGWTYTRTGEKGDRAAPGTKVTAVAGTEPAETGADGDPGTLSLQAGVSAASLLSDYPPAWLTMLLNRARMAMFQAYVKHPAAPDPEQLRIVDDLVGWLQVLLGDGPQDDPALLAVWSQVRHLHQLRGKGLNLFGRKGESVPLRLWTDFKNITQEVADRYFEVAGHFASLQTKAVTGRDTRDLVTARKDAANNQKKALEDENRDKLEPRLNELVRLLKDDQVRREGAQRKFDNALKSLKGKVDTFFNFNLTDLVDAFQQIAFVPPTKEGPPSSPSGLSPMGVANAVGQTWKLLDTCTTKVKLNDGSVIDKSKLVDQLTAYAGDVEGLHAA